MVVLDEVDDTEPLVEVGGSVRLELVNGGRLMTLVDDTDVVLIVEDEVEVADEVEDELVTSVLEVVHPWRHVAMAVVVGVAEYVLEPSGLLSQS
jgi:hypothetical protein